MKGLVSDIQRFSVHDGPGIRTTVFLKGCNLHCRWCHNPETISPKAQLQVFADKCIGCGACLKACTQKAHVLADGPKKEFHRELCQACGQCARTCYAQSLVMVGRTMSPQDVTAEVLQDIEFYRNSNGGLTVSGGEPLTQRDFTIEVLRLAKEAGVHTAIESNMVWPWEHVLPVLNLLDLVIMDIKAMDDNVHKEWTGQSNKHPLANVLKLGRQKPRLIVRTPIVPGVNDRPDEIRQIAEHIAGLPALDYYELLPYHPLGTGKYHSLGMHCPTEGIARPTKDKILELAAAARQCGITVRTSQDARK